MKSGFRSIGKWYKQREYDSHTSRLFLVLMVIFLLMAASSPNTFLTRNTFTSIGYQLPEFGLYALAMMFAMMLGGIDLSIVSIGNLSGIIIAQFMSQNMASGSGNESSIIMLVCAFALAILTGAVCGAINGISITIIGIQPILATLATMQIFNGISIAMTKGSAVVGLPKIFAGLGNNTIGGFFPIILVAFLIIAVVLSLLMSKTRFGMDLYMVGSNRRVAQFSGIHCNRVTITSYMIGGILSAIAGLIVASRSMSAKVGYGEIYQLQAILAVVLGGVSPKGGFGKVSGVFLSIVSLQMLSVGVNILRISDSTFIKNLLWGGLLIGVMVMNYILDRYRDHNLAIRARRHE